MKSLTLCCAACAGVGLALAAPRFATGDVAVNLTGYAPQCGVQVQRDGARLLLSWHTHNAEQVRCILNLQESAPLIESLACTPGKPAAAPAQGIGAAALPARRPAADAAPAIVWHAEPVFFVTVGTREAPPGKPPEQTWQVFFDSPHRRPHATFAATRQTRQVRVESAARRCTVTLDGLTAGPFAGHLELTCYADCNLLRVAAVMSTDEDRRAFFYDAGLVSDTAFAARADAGAAGAAEGAHGTGGAIDFAWYDTQGRLQQPRLRSDAPSQALAVRYRALALRGEGGAVAVFPPPHQFFFPRDWTDNLRYVWLGRGYQKDERFGVGVRQHPDGGGNFVPWFNAPPGTQQRMSFFVLATAGSPSEALDETLRYTHGDRFPDLPGYRTLTSHYHMATAVAALDRKLRGQPPLANPDYVQMFKAMNVHMVHLAEFHGDGHQKDPGPLRLRELESMFEECRRLSDEQLLLIPGEEVNTFLGLELPGKHPGHWMCLFPRPVYWIMQREASQPWVEHDPRLGKIYRVGSRHDMQRLLEEEAGLAWTAHPRIKASSWTPDVFRNEDFYLADTWLGGAWKAMPADLSRDKLGERALDLLSDMANWGQKKYVLGEVDVFKLDRTHELYGHMNINYVQLQRVPRFDDGWPELLDALRQGRFFVTTGEVLIPRCTIGGRSSGQTLRLTSAPVPGTDAARVPVEAHVRWTFPLEFAELVSGDGQQVYRQRLDLRDTRPLDQRTLRFEADLRGRTWARLEVWDTAVNGAFTQPVWIE
jgi:hypothetical protein